MTKEKREDRVKQLRQKYHKLNKKRNILLRSNSGKGNSYTKILKNEIDNISKALDIHLKKLDKHQEL